MLFVLVFMEPSFPYLQVSLEFVLRMIPVTRELANSMALASISAAEYGKNKLTVSELFEAVQFDGSGFDDNRRYLAKHYVEMFNSVDIPISAHLKQFL